LESEATNEERAMSLAEMADIVRLVDEYETNQRAKVA
jgi:hypothetical protein